ncbi:MAG TPA: ASCH domain-containing protein [Rhizomicrobium sp.]|jgi:hypothetical protein|nr:ASCH domain-containing protein [Rhizomicrobium sp.]
MKALTIWQPWATLIMAGAKRYEFRRWDYSERYPAIASTRIVIHAGARAMKRNEIEDILMRIDDGDSALVEKIARPLIERILAAHSSSPGLPLASGLGTSTILRAHRATNLFKGVIDSDRIDQHVYAWPLQAIEPFPHPIPCRGAQGFWNWPKDWERAA